MCKPVMAKTCMFSYKLSWEHGIYKAKTAICCAELNAGRWQYVLAGSTQACHMTAIHAEAACSNKYVLTLLHAKAFQGHAPHAA